MNPVQSINTQLSDNSSVSVASIIGPSSANFIDKVDIADIAALRFDSEESTEKLLKRAEREISRKIIDEVLPGYLSDEEMNNLRSDLEEGAVFDEKLAGVIEKYPEVEDEIKVISRKYKKDLLKKIARDLHKVGYLMDNEYAGIKKDFDEENFEKAFAILQKEEGITAVE